MPSQPRPSALPSCGHFKDFYSLRGYLGKGSYAVVYECVHRETGEVYAVKVVDKTKTGPKDIDDLTHEINIMSIIGYHPHVVQMIEYFSTERHLYIVMDLLSGGMLFDRIVQLKHYSEQNAAELVRNFLSSLNHIHSKGIIHRDLKPENLLLRYSESSAPSTASHLTDVCLADFGLAGYVPSTTCCGSPSYIAPEVINVGYYLSNANPYDSKCDIWSLGVITYILISGKMPFHGSNFKETFSRIVAGKWGFVGDIWSKVTPAAKDFITQCLRMNPKERPCAAELLRHPWVSENQPDVHLEDSLEGLRKFNAHQKIRAAVRVFCWTQQLLGCRLDRTPPFMRYLRHEDEYSTIVYHQSQTDPKLEHAVDFAKTLEHDQPGFRMQDCCTCPSEKVCRHIQNVHEYLFVGCRYMEVYPFINELKMMKAEAECDLEADPKDKDAAEKLRKTNRAIDAACVFSDELAKVPPDELKPNLMIDATRNNTFHLEGGAKSMTSMSTSTKSPNGKDAAAEKLADRFKARQAAKREAEKASTAAGAASAPASTPAKKASSPGKGEAAKPRLTSAVLKTPPATGAGKKPSDTRSSQGTPSSTVKAPTGATTAATTTATTTTTITSTPVSKAKKISK